MNIGQQLAAIANKSDGGKEFRRQERQEERMTELVNEFRKAFGAEPPGSTKKQREADLKTLDTNNVKESIGRTKDYVLKQLWTLEGMGFVRQTGKVIGTKTLEWRWILGK